jgi:hypothetical protein
MRAILDLQSESTQPYAQAPELSAFSYFFCGSTWSAAIC